jgi:hypothetical protein
MRNKKPRGEHGIDQKLDLIVGLLEVLITRTYRILVREGKIMATLDQLVTAVTEEDTVEASVLALLVAIKAQLDAALANSGIKPEDQAKIDAVFAAVEASKAKLADAIVANTPAA